MCECVWGRQHNVCAWVRLVYCMCFSVFRWSALVYYQWQTLWWATNIRRDRFSLFLSINQCDCLSIYLNISSSLYPLSLIPHLLLLCIFVSVSFSLLTPCHISSSSSSSSPLVLLLCSSSLPFLLLLPVAVLRAEELLLVFSFPEPLLDIEPSSSLGNRL